MGLPGQDQYVIAVNEFRDPKDPRNLGGPAGLPGQYGVIFTLSRPEFPLLPENRHSFGNALKGDSHLAITKPAYVPPGNPDADRIKIHCTTNEGSFIFEGRPNDRGFLGKITVESIHGENFADAEQRAYRMLSPSLSHWSIHLDIPLHIFQIDSIELRTRNTRTRFLNPTWEVPFSLAPQVTLGPEFRFYASLYREALNSNTPVYQFLCFFKIVEALQNRRNRLNAEARSKGNEVFRLVEWIPEDVKNFVPWLNAIFPVRRGWDPMSLESIFLPEARGRKVNSIVESDLRPLRVKIAHAISDSGELTLSADEALDIQTVQKWIPLTKCIVRRLLKNEFRQEFLSYLREDGTIEGTSTNAGNR